MKGGDQDMTGCKSYGAFMKGYRGNKKKKEAGR